MTKLDAQVLLLDVTKKVNEICAKNQKEKELVAKIVKYIRYNVYCVLDKEY